MAIASVTIGVLLRRTSGVPPWGEAVIVTVIAVAVTRMVAERRAIYTVDALLNPLAQIGRLCSALVIGSLAAGGSLYLLHDRPGDIPYLVIQPIAWAIASGAAMLAMRSAVAAQLHPLARAGRLSTRVALIGANRAGLQFVQDAGRDPRVTIIGIFDDRTYRLPDTSLTTWLRGDVSALVALARRHPIDAVVIALPLDETDRIAEMRRRLAGIATDVFLTTDAAALAYTGARFSTLGPASVLSVSTRPLKDWPAFKKSAFDRIASACLMLLALPLLAIIAAIVKLDTPGPVLFRQRREGLNGQLFTMLKFRSMHCQPGADESAQATARDHRVTRSGYWLRRFSLDELPQLWNVLRGDMSLVGPRPHLATTRAGSRLFSEIVPHYQARHRMKPGLTGWAQVQGLRGETLTEKDITDRVEQDLYYIDNWSLGLDLRIILRTIFREIIVSRSGRAY